MATVKHLQGWLVDARKKTVPTEDGDGMEERWELGFIETQPPTRNMIVFEMDEETKGELVRKLTGGLHVPL